MKILAIGDFQGEFPEKLKSRIKKEEFDLVVGVGDYSGIKDFYPYVRYLFRQTTKGKEPVSAKEFFGKKKLKSLEKKDFEAGKKILSYLDNRKESVVGIFGNTDDGWYKYLGSKKDWSEKKKINYLKRLNHAKLFTYGKKSVHGIEFIGSGGYMDIPSYFKEKTLPGKEDYIPIRRKRHLKIKKKLVNSIKSAYKRKGDKIFIFHYPPLGVFDIIRDKRNAMNGKSAGIDFFREAIKKYKPSLVLCGHMAEYQGMKRIYGVPVVNPGAAHHGRAAIIDIDQGKVKKIKFIH